MPKFSIIIPVYNVAQYIRACFDSIKAQTFGDFEVICVNDCSTDNTLYIMDEYLKSDERFKLINHEHNSGPGVARNTGIDNAKGEYIVCIDTDDFAEETLLEVLNNTFNSTDADCVWFNANIYNKKTEKKELLFKEDKVLTDNSFNNITPDNIARCPDYVWNKAFKTSVIKDYNLRFPNFWIGEDSQFYFETFTKLKRIYFLNKSLYTHIIREGSLVENAKKGEADFKATFDIFLNVYDYCKKNNLVHDYKNALCQLLVIRINNRTALNQNEKILRLADDVLSKINFPDCFIEN